MLPSRERSPDERRAGSAQLVVYTSAAHDGDGANESPSSVARLLGCARAGLDACWLAGLGAWVLGCLLGYTSVGPYAVVWRRQQGRYWAMVAIASLSLKPSGTQAATGFPSAVLLSAGIHVHVALRQQPRLQLAPV
jgi:hypothetical protein